MFQFSKTQRGGTKKTNWNATAGLHVVFLFICSLDLCCRTLFWFLWVNYNKTSDSSISLLEVLKGNPDLVVEGFFALPGSLACVKASVHILLLIVKMCYCLYSLGLVVSAYLGEFKAKVLFSTNSFSAAKIEIPLFNAFREFWVSTAEAPATVWELCLLRMCYFDYYWC